MYAARRPRAESLDAHVTAHQRHLVPVARPSRRGAAALHPYHLRVLTCRRCLREPKRGGRTRAARSVWCELADVASVNARAKHAGPPVPPTMIGAATSDPHPSGPLRLCVVRRCDLRLATSSSQLFLVTVGVAAAWRPCRPPLPTYWAGWRCVGRALRLYTSPSLRERPEAQLRLSAYVLATRLPRRLRTSIAPLAARV